MSFHLKVTSQVIKTTITKRTWQGKGTRKWTKRISAKLHADNKENNCQSSLSEGHVSHLALVTNVDLTSGRVVDPLPVQSSHKPAACTWPSGRVLGDRHHLFSGFSPWRRRGSWVQTSFSTSIKLGKVTFVLLSNMPMRMIYISRPPTRSVLRCTKSDA